MSARNEVLALAKRKLVRPEALVQKEIVQLLRLKHIPHWRIGQRDARGTQDPGVPDIVCFPPMDDSRLVDQDRCATLWIEVKRSDGGRWAPAQQAFARCVGSTDGHSFYLLAKDPQEVVAALGWVRQGCRPR